MEAAKGEAAEVAHTAADAAKDVGRSAKEEAGSVVGEAKDQIQGLYDQTRSELAQEAAKQQNRVATGLQTVGDDLDSMARNAEGGGLARELVRETSQRVDRVATWLSEREPGAVLDEVKSFARRQPGVFIGFAAIAGVVAGRLTRALAANAQDEQQNSAASEGQGRVVSAATPAAAPLPPVVPPAPPVPSAQTGSSGTPGSPVSPRTPGTPAGPEAPGSPGAAPGLIPGATGAAGAHAASDRLPGAAGSPLPDPLSDAEEDRRRGLSRTDAGEEASDDRPHTF